MLYILPIPTAAGIKMATEFYRKSEIRSRFGLSGSEMRLLLTVPLTDLMDETRNAVSGYPLEYCDDLQVVRSTPSLILSLWDFTFKNNRGGCQFLDDGVFGVMAEMDLSQEPKSAEVQRAVQVIAEFRKLLAEDDLLASRIMDVQQTNGKYEFIKPQWWVNKLWEREFERFNSTCEK